MRILILNWKDHHHPLAGGAEDYTFNIMKRLVRRGHTVLWYTSTYPKAPAHSFEDGIEFIRQGSYRTVHGKSKRFIRALTTSDKPDVIVDEVNTRPFNPSRWLTLDVPVVNLIHQLAREVWFYEVPLPFALIGRYILEDHWLKSIRNHVTITVSKSTALDLTSLGFHRVRLVFNALPDGQEWHQGPKMDPPLILYLGRLSNGKRPRDCLEAFRRIRKHIDCSTVVIGAGPLLPRLRREYPETTFLGRVPEEDKHALLTKATIILATGTREGWNRGILEAQAHGVVPVVQNIPGLRDAVDQGGVGLVVPPRSPQRLAEAACSILQQGGELRSLAISCQRWASGFTYDASSKTFERVLNGTWTSIPD